MMDEEALLNKALAPKSDQINSDDLIGTSMTIKIVKVVVRDADQQPIDIFFEGEIKKPYRPCKSMGRVLKHFWSNQPRNWVGRSMTLYRDPDVLWGGLKVGGIRISHLSHIKNAETISLTASKSNRKPFTVQPLKVDENPDDAEYRSVMKAGNEKAALGMDALGEWWKSLNKRQMALAGKEQLAAWKDIAAKVVAKPDHALTGDDGLGWDYSNGDPDPAYIPFPGDQ